MSLKKKNKTVKSKYTEQFVPIKNITNGMITLDNNEKVTGLKIVPRNIFISDSATQIAIISNLQNVYNVIDYEFWVIAADRPVDINVFLSELQLLYAKSTDSVVRKIIMEDIEKANTFTNNNVVDTEYFILFKHKDAEVLNKRLRQLITMFANAGLVSHQVSNDDLRVILDNFLNGGQTTNFGGVFA